MRILYLATTVSKCGGGIARSVPQLASSVAEAGVDAHMVYVDHGLENTLSLCSDSVKRHPISCKGTLLSKYNVCQSLIAFLEKFNSESGSDFIIHHSGIWTCFNHIVCHFGYKKGVPVVCSPRGMLDPWSINHHLFRKKMAWYAYAAGDMHKTRLFHATSKQEETYIRGLGFQQPIIVLPNGVITPMQIIKRSLPKTQNHRTAFFLSRINPKKGLLMLIEAWGKLKPKNWRLVIAGNDDSNHLPKIKRSIQCLGLEDCVDIVGPLDGEAKDAAYSCADFFVLPTFTENFGLVVAEALSHGVPVLTTHGAPWRELETHKCGWWVPANVQGIYDGLSSAISASDQQRLEMGLRGRELVAKNYSWSEIGKEMAKAYQEHFSFH